MQIFIHQTHHQIADFSAIFDDLKAVIKTSQPGVHLFPELFLTGYPLQDLCLQKSFFNTYLKFLNELRQWCAQHEFHDQIFLVGGLDYALTEEGNPLSIKNVIFEFSSQRKGQPIYTKRLLPNYDIFDEKKYFTKGDEPKVLNYRGKHFGLLICEDMWASTFYDLDPIEELDLYCRENDIQLDAVLNLSASPYNMGKSQMRIQRGFEISRRLKAPFFYANRVGGEDEIIFDGGSFILNDSEILVEGKVFEADQICFNITQLPRQTYASQAISKPSLIWEDLFEPRLDLDQSPPVLKTWDNDIQISILEALKFGFQEYATRNGFHSFSLALSGGIDSALALTIMKLSLKPGQSIEAIYMPSKYSSDLSYELSLQLCQNLGIPLKTLPIKSLHTSTQEIFQQNFTESFQGLTDENVQSRLRGLFIYTRSNQIGSMVVNTSNKSELAVGYSTQYGDSVGAISLLGDLYKTEVYRLARYINQKFDAPIPESIITRPPSAELRPDQKDTDSLVPYERLDAILESILTYRHDKQSLIALGFQAEEVTKTLNLYKKSEYKRYQFCPILKINSKSFGFGYRIPLTKASEFY